MEVLLGTTALTFATAYFLKSSTPLAVLLWVAIYPVFAFFVPFARNWISARRTGFPQVWIPWDPHSFVWMVVQHPLAPTLRKWMPKPLWDRVGLTMYGWEFWYGFRPFNQYAAPQGNRKTFVSVTFTKGIEIYTWDSEIATQVLARPKDFRVQDLTKVFMDKFGNSVLTSNGDDWSRQRKIVASVINERISKAVFNETIRQTGGLIDELYSKQARDASVVDTNRMFDLMKKITIHVLSGVGMGASVPWDDEKGDAPKPGYKMNYMQACKTVTTAVGGPIILPQWFLDNYPWSWPGAKFLRNLGDAVREFPMHTRDMLESERQRSAMSKDGEARSNIMSQLLRASENTGGKGPTLSESELTGNLFIFTVAGFDTTANTLGFALMLLARNPEWQGWLDEEIDQLMPAGQDGLAELDYAEVHPKAVRTLALMYETLRLFPALVHMVKQAHGDVVLQTSSGTHVIPDGTYMYVCNVQLHLDSDIWRNLNIHDEDGESSSDDDELKFRPSRWLNPKSASSTFFQPPKGTYLPWSTGPRSCPGIKMAQVEFTAIMLTLLRQCRIEATPKPGETRADIEQRLDEQMRHSLSKLTLEMREIYDVTDEDQGFKLRLQKRV